MYIGLFSLVLLYVLSKIYARRAEKNVNIDIHRAPAPESEEGQVNPLNYRIAQLAQFGITSGIECLFGAIVGAVYGPVLMIWCVLGTTFMGAVLNYYCGMYARTHHNRTINTFVRERFGLAAYGVSTLLLTFFTIVTVSAGYSFLININFYGYTYPQIGFVYMLYAATFAVLPKKWFFRSYIAIAAYFAFVTAICALCILFKKEIVNIPFDMSTYPDIKFTYPALMIVISAGAVSGMQGLKSMVISPVIRNEKMGRGIFFGAAVAQAAFVIIWDLMILASYPSFSALNYIIRRAATPYIILQEAMVNSCGSFVAHLVFAMACLLCIGASGVMLRFNRIMWSETKLFGKWNKFVSTGAVLVLSRYFYNHEIGLSYFEICNQLIAAYLLYILAAQQLKQRKKGTLCLYPAFVLTGTCLAYLALTVGRQPLLNSISIGLAVTVILFAGYFWKARKSAQKN